MRMTQRTGLCIEFARLLSFNPRMSSLELARFFDQSADYCGRVIRHLTQAGLVTTVRGCQGGFALARAAAEISLLEIVEASEGHLPLAPTGVKPTSPAGKAIARAHEAFQKVLADVSLADLA